MSKRFVQLIKNYLKHLPTAFSANLFFLFPSRRLKLIGITGTDGKPTTASLIYHLLQQSGIRVGLVSTVGVKLSGEEFPLDFHVTSPPPWKLQRFLKMMVKKKLTHAVLEVTSHALDQFRFFGCSFYITVLTNVTHEHLDYHSSFGNYLATKIKLLKSSPIVVINKDDPSFKQVASRLMKKKLITFAVKQKADYQAKSILHTRKGVSYNLWIKGKKMARINSSILGDFNVYNQLAATAVADQLGIPLEAIGSDCNRIKEFSRSNRQARIYSK
jgi:UDP-N-acetylmuramoyl-L-alanyl-D-glutamate--2,6-diaminopimelate ligase